ncbi:hypothetical protein ABIA69_002360 [Lysinibacillus parviboronicapiens]|uniref:Uncharacterized protein n=1 Tax=Lysinibacillus parviboronicapiens TaxID=436516 RepID=A0ABV2PJV8_9BACI|nr:MULTISPECIES: hypothetical protein [Lysinibacillus]AHN24529.1 hypothetical protein T479_22525 [Lysinibacillus varians]AHN24530.1 hypothetical protein T479_22530 [Lysinibacillus varians]
MSCDQSKVSYKVIQGSSFCSGACGTKKLRWQNYRYVYTNGTDCYGDEYQGCC